MPSRALGPASESCVFLSLHRDREEFILDYKRVVTEFLPEKFNHPMFLFLRPDGTEISPELRHEHMYMSGSQIVKVLKKYVWPETGKGLTPKAWKKAEEGVVAARTAMDAGEFRQAERALAPVLKIKPKCGVRDRAGYMQKDIEARRSLLALWDRASADMKDPPEKMREHLLAGDLFAARRAISARLLPGFEEKLVAEIKSRFDLTEAWHQLTIMGTSAHHYLEATFSCGLQKAEGLRVEVSVLSEAGDVLDGNALVPVVGYSSRRMFCATLTARSLKGNLVKAIRARLYLDDLLLAEKIEETGPSVWPESQKAMVGPDFYEPGDAWHVSRDLELTEIRVGRVGS